MMPSQSLSQLEQTTSLMNILHVSPAPTAATLSYLSTDSEIFAAINTLNQGIFPTRDRLGSLEQLVANVPSISEMVMTALLYN